MTNIGNASDENDCSSDRGEDEKPDDIREPFPRSSNSEKCYSNAGFDCHST